MGSQDSVLALSPWPTARAMEGGGTPVLADLLESLVAGGNDVNLVLVRDDEAARVPEGVVVHRVAPRRPARGWAGRQLAQAAFTFRLTIFAVRLGRRIDGLRAVYGLSALTIPAAAASARVLGKPSVGVLFGTFMYPALDSWAGRLQQLEEWIAFKTPVTRLVVLDDGTRGNLVAERLNVPSARLRFWMHGLDFAACDAARGAPSARAELRIAADAPLVVSSSRLAQWKRVDRVIDAFARVVERHPDAVLAIAGSGPDRERLESHVARAGLAESVVFTGPLPSEVNLRLMVAADVICSLYELSNVGVSLLEALACGAAVVVGDTGATRAYVHDGENGFVVPEDDAEAAAVAITRLIDDGELKRRLGDAARRRARAEFLTKEARRRLELGLLAEIG